MVEVVLAIGIVAFAFVALLALLPTGLTSFRKAMNASIGSEVGQRVFNDLQQTNFDTLLSQTTPALAVSQGPQQPTSSPDTGQQGSLPHRFFDDEGGEVIVPGLSGTADPTPAQRQASHILYDVHSEIILKAQIPSSTASANGVILSPNLANVLIQVISNPGGLAIPETLSSDPAIPSPVIFTQFSGCLSRNGRTNPGGS